MACLNVYPPTVELHTCPLHKRNVKNFEALPISMVVDFIGQHFEALQISTSCYLLHGVDKLSWSGPFSNVRSACDLTHLYYRYMNCKLGMYVVDLCGTNVDSIFRN